VTGRGWGKFAAAVLAAAGITALGLASPGGAAGPKGHPNSRAAQAPKARPKPAPHPLVAGPNIDTQAKHAIVVEAETGAVLYAKFPDERMPPASMSKMMTAYVVFDMLKQGRIKLTDQLPVSEHAWRTGGSKMFVPVGSRISIDDLLRGMIVQSGNDSCVVLAEGLAGSEAAFVDLMNEKAKQLGLKNSHFNDVDGLPDPDHWMSARDLAILAQRTIEDFPEYYHYYSEKEFAFSGIEQGNRNPLLYTTPGTDGLKTGHTEEAGYSLTASVKRDNRRIILVIAGLPTMKARSEEGARLAEWAFREFNDYKLFAAGDRVDEADVWLGAAPKVPLVIDRDLTVTLPRRARKDMKVTVSYDRPVPAPIRKGDPIGKLEVTAPDTPAIDVPLSAGADVPRIGTLGRMATVAAYLIWGNKH